MSKYSKFMKYFLATPLIFMVLFIVAMIFINLLNLSLLGFTIFLISSAIFFIILPIMVYLGDTVLPRKYPNISDPEEIKNLKASLEQAEVRDFIHFLHYNKHKNISKIAQRVEKKFKIKIHYKWGRLEGEIKEGLDDKISQILGYKDYGDYWKNHGILKTMFNPIEVEYDFSENPNRTIKRVYPYGKDKFRPEPLEDPRIFKKKIELIQLERIASKYHKKGKIQKAVEWYQLKLKVLLEIREPSHSDIIELKEKIEELKKLF